MTSYEKLKASNRKLLDNQETLRQICYEYEMVLWEIANLKGGDMAQAPSLAFKALKEHKGK